MGGGRGLTASLKLLSGSSLYYFASHAYNRPLQYFQGYFFSVDVDMFVIVPTMVIQ